MPRQFRGESEGLRARLRRGFRFRVRTGVGESSSGPNLNLVPTPLPTLTPNLALSLLLQILLSPSLIRKPDLFPVPLAVFAAVVSALVIRWRSERSGWESFE